MAKTIVVMNAHLEELGILSVDQLDPIEKDWVHRSVREIEQSQGSPYALASIQHDDYLLTVTRTYDHGTQSIYYVVS